MGHTRFSVFAARCPECAANLHVERATENAVCQYCGTSVLLARKKPTAHQPVPVPTARVHVAPWVWILPIILTLAVTAFSLLAARSQQAAVTHQVQDSQARTQEALRRAGVPTAQPTGESASREQLLGRKLDEIVPCVNARALDSRRRYLSWVNVKRGPSAKARHISYGLYEASLSEHCQAGLTEAAGGPPASPPLDQAVTAYVATYQEIAPHIAEAAAYYEAKDYLDDHAAKGKELHPVLMRDFEAFAVAYQQLADALDQQATELMTHEIAAAKSADQLPEYWGRKSFVTARALMAVADQMQVRKPATLKLDAFVPLLDQLLAELTELRAAGDASWKASYLDATSGFVNEAKGLRRRAERGRRFTRTERDWLGTSAGWMVSDSADSMRNQFDSLLGRQRELFGGFRVLH